MTGQSSTDVHMIHSLGQQGHCLLCADLTRRGSWVPPCEAPPRQSSKKRSPFTIYSDKPAFSAKCLCLHIIGICCT